MAGFTDRDDQQGQVGGLRDSAGISLLLLGFTELSKMLRETSQQLPEVACV